MKSPFVALRVIKKDTLKSDLSWNVSEQICLWFGFDLQTAMFRLLAQIWLLAYQARNHMKSSFCKSDLNHIWRWFKMRLQSDLYRCDLVWMRNGVQCVFCINSCRYVCDVRTGNIKYNTYDIAHSYVNRSDLSDKSDLSAVWTWPKSPLKSYLRGFSFST